MNRTLEDLSKLDWNVVYPIKLEAHDPKWSEIFKEEQSRLQLAIGSKTNHIEHVGSTSIPYIQSKPYIDISIEIPEDQLFSETIIVALQGLGYHYFRQQGTGVDYMVFVKGYHLDGSRDQVFHIHMCPPGHEMLDQIAFRDYLIDHPERAREYEKLKIGLAVQYRNNRVGYRVAKDEFVQETMQLIRDKAKEE